MEASFCGSVVRMTPSKTRLSQCLPKGDRDWKMKPDAKRMLTILDPNSPASKWTQTSTNTDRNDDVRKELNKSICILKWKPIDIVVGRRQRLWDRIAQCASSYVHGNAFLQRKPKRPPSFYKDGKERKKSTNSNFDYTLPAVGPSWMSRGDEVYPSLTNYIARKELLPRLGMHHQASTVEMNPSLAGCGQSPRRVPRPSGYANTSDKSLESLRLPSVAQVGKPSSDYNDYWLRFLKSQEFHREGRLNPGRPSS